MATNPMVVKLQAFEWQWKMRALYEKGALPIKEEIVYKPDTENQEAVSYIPAVEMRDPRFAKLIEAEGAGPAYYVKGVERHFDRGLDKLKKELADKIQMGFEAAQSELEQKYAHVRKSQSIEYKKDLQFLEEKRDLSISALEKKCEQIRKNFYDLAMKETTDLKREIQMAVELSKKGIKVAFQYSNCVSYLDHPPGQNKPLTFARNAKVVPVAENELAAEPAKRDKNQLK